MKIIMTGGGTAGHVTPNIALFDRLKQEGFEIEYVGSTAGMEKDLITACGIPYYPISTGKLRRYLSKKNISDALRVCKGFSDSIKIIKKLKPDVIFSKGGFVSVPVVIAGRFKKVPVVIHESDITPGLANRISMRFADSICYSFPETRNRLSSKKSVFTGTPVRKELFLGTAEKALKKCGFTEEKPVILVMGGSQGSAMLNKALRNILTELLEKFDIIHLCGKGNLCGVKPEGYCELEYASDDLSDIFAAADIVVSRAGSNSLFELLALKKPNLLIPLSKKVSRGDQIENALSFKAQGFSEVMFEEEITDLKLYEAINSIYSKRSLYIKKMSETKQKDSIAEIVKVIKEAALKRQK